MKKQTLLTLAILTLARLATLGQASSTMAVSADNNGGQSVKAVTTTQAADYTLDITVANGSVIKIPDKTFYSAGETVELVGRPDIGYYFTNWSGDIQSKRLMYKVTVSSDMNITANFDIWQPPIGIPEPEFGIRETYRMYDDTMNRNSALTYTQNVEGGYFTHHIDNTHPNATDSNNPYGTMDKPRMSLPDDSDAPAGSVVEIHGGPYDLGYTIYRVIGTEQMPIFIRGFSDTDRVELNDGDLYVNCVYTIWENIKRAKAGLVVRSFSDRQAHHVTVRNSNIQTMVALSWDEGSSEDIVFYGNYVDSNGFDPEDGEFPENDGGGIAIALGSNRVWIIDNYITRASGDGVGAGHAANYTARNYYIGRNVIHTCGENALDVKEVDTVIVSENSMYNFQGWSSGSDGTAIVLHYGPIHSPKNVWFIHNEVFDCVSKAIQVGGDQHHDVFIIGNVIHDIHNENHDAYGYHTWNSRKVFLINNLFYNTDNAIRSRVDAAGGELYMLNNIISEVSDSGNHLDMDGSSHLQNSVIENNLFYQSQGDVRIDWGGAVYDIAEFIANTDQGDGCIQADPLLVGAANNDFRLQAESPAIDKGIEHSAYQLFKDTYGLSIKLDRNGTPRPQGARWDIGAYEFAPDLQLYGTPANVTIHLTWAVNVTLPVTSTWRIGYESDSGTLEFPAAEIPTATVRSHTLVSLTNGVWYTVTLNAMLDESPWLTDTIRVMPTSHLIYLPLASKNH